MSLTGAGISVNSITSLLFFASKIKTGRPGRAGILLSKEGIHGCVRFAKSEDKITVLDILTAIEGPKPLFQTNFEMKAKVKRPDSVKLKVIQTLNTAEENKEEGT